MKSNITEQSGANGVHFIRFASKWLANIRNRCMLRPFKPVYFYVVTNQTTYTHFSKCNGLI